MYSSTANVLILVHLATIAAIKTGLNKNLLACFNKYDVSDKFCGASQADPQVIRCNNSEKVIFYCASSSPIDVVIGGSNSSKKHKKSFEENLHIDSNVSSVDGLTHCVKISGMKIWNYFLQCRNNMTSFDESKWIHFYPDPNHIPPSLPNQYVAVKKTDPTDFCKTSDTLLKENAPVLLPCNTWQKCAFLLAQQNATNVSLVDLSRILKTEPSNCSIIESLIKTLQNGQEMNYSKPGLLKFDPQLDNSFLIPYNPVIQTGSQNDTGATALVPFQLKGKQSGPWIEVECLSSVLHTCGLEVVTNQSQIVSSSVGCHKHSMTLKTSPGMNTTVICRAFNDFYKTWDTATISFESPLEELDVPQESATSLPLSILGGAVVGGICICCLILLPLLIYFYKKTQFQRRKIHLTEEEIFEFMEGLQKEKAESKGVHNVFVLPYDSNLEIPKTAVIFNSTILGSGAFGKVFKGRYQGQDVAIKTVDATLMNADAFRSLLSELKIMSYLGKHEHIIELVGAITSDLKKGEVFLILEFCAHGNVVNYIREHRDGFLNFLSDDKNIFMQTSSNSVGVDDCVSGLSSKHLVKWSYEVACGMEYVSSRNIFHGDLAARNILLTENLTVKVGDFGLSRQLDIEKYASYTQKKECPLPLKWMAIESLRDLKFSIQSDVWSFGVTLWEFFSLGTIPYPGMDWNMESWKSLCAGMRLDRPDCASKRIYNNVMRTCWEEHPKDRPTFSILKAVLNDELQDFK